MFSLEEFERGLQIRMRERMKKLFNADLMILTCFVKKKTFSLFYTCSSIIMTKLFDSFSCRQNVNSFASQNNIKSIFLISFTQHITIMHHFNFIKYILNYYIK